MAPFHRLALRSSNAVNRMLVVRLNYAKQPSLRNPWDSYSPDAQAFHHRFTYNSLYND
jgi:hypothetical protein